MSQHRMHIDGVQYELNVHFLVYDQYILLMKGSDRMNLV